jgi:hypothetical protein
MIKSDKTPCLSWLFRTTRLLWVTLLFGILAACGQDTAEVDKQSADQAKPSLSKVLEDHQAIPGLLTMYRNDKTGKGFLVIEASQLDKPFLYMATTVNGVLDAGHFKGFYRYSGLLEFRKYYDRIDIISKTPRYYFDPSNPISKASDTNISEAVLVSAKIESEESGRYAIKLSDVFLNEKLHPIAPWPDDNPEVEKQRFKVGGLAEGSSRILNIDNFPKNSHVVVDYVFNNPVPMVEGGKEISDPRSVSIKLQHAFVELPDNDFVARRDDPRIGYFGQQFDDLTSDETANYRDVIDR